MVIRLIKKAFGGGESAAKASVKTAEDNKSLSGFVEYVVKQLVDNPGQVNINSNEKDGQVVIEITCAKDDMGKVIGRRGKTISAIRSLVISAARREDKKVSVEVID